MKIACDNKQFCAAILTDLSKAFDCICHDRLIAKLNTYGFDRNALKLIYDFLSDRSRKTKKGCSFSAYLDIIYGVPQGSILGLLLFNIDICTVCSCHVTYAFESESALYSCLNVKELLARSRREI